MVIMLRMKVMVIKSKICPLEYLVETYLYLVDFINNVKGTNNSSKIHFSIKIMFEHFKDVDEEWEMHLKSNSIILNSATLAKQLIQIFS